MKQILAKAESQTEPSGNSIRPDGEVLIAVSSLCLLNHTTLGAADRPALRLGDFEACVMGFSCSDCLICLALCEEDLHPGVLGPWLCPLSLYMNTLGQMVTLPSSLGHK